MAMPRSDRSGHARVGTEAQAEDGSPGLRLQLDRSAHQFRQLPCDRQPQAAPRRDRALDAVEAVEDVRGVLARNAGTLVLDLEQRHAVAAVAAETDRRSGR